MLRIASVFALAELTGFGSHRGFELIADASPRDVASRQKTDVCGFQRCQLSWVEMRTLRSLWVFQKALLHTDRALWRV